MKNLTFTRNTATVSDISEHLNICSENFVPILSSRVNIVEYSNKIFNYAKTIESWNNTTLVGLLSIYCNNDKTNVGFITNLSVIPEYHKQNIASQLLDICIEFSKEIGLDAIKLEVKIKNLAAMALYKKFGFIKHRNIENGAQIAILQIH